MDKSHHWQFNAQERSYLAILKKDVHAIARQAGFSDARVADIDIVVSEITSNLVKHAKGGILLVRVEEGCLECIGIDSGPGMNDVHLMTQDGMSTTNTLGHGLGAIRRLSDECDMYSLHNWGTVSLARFYKKPLPYHGKKPAAEVRSIVIAKPGEYACGDGVAVSFAERHFRVMLGDGLGHGPEAQAVVTGAKAAFMESPGEASSVDLLRSMHEGVKGSRGLVATAAVFDFNRQSWGICGVGNTSAWTGNPRQGRGIMSYNGIVGVNMPASLHEHIVADEYGQLLIICSDGFRPRWELQHYPFILRHDLSILAAALYKDYARQTDDMSILITRINKRS